VPISAIYQGPAVTNYRGALIERGARLFKPVIIGMLRIPPRSSDSPWNNRGVQVKLVSIHLEQTEVVSG
jgi:hypothetical protein